MFGVENALYEAVIALIGALAALGFFGAFFAMRGVFRK